MISEKNSQETSLNMVPLLKIALDELLKVYSKYVFVLIIKRITKKKKWIEAFMHTSN